MMHSETDSGSFQPSSTAAPLTGFRYAHANLYLLLLLSCTVKKPTAKEWLNAVSAVLLNNYFTVIIYLFIYLFIWAFRNTVCLLSISLAFLTLEILSN